VQVGVARVDITPPLPVDLMGFVRRPVAPLAALDPLEVRALVARDGDSTAVIFGADLMGMTPAFADWIRSAVADAIGCAATDVLVNCSHTHAAPSPGAANKMGGEFDGWTELELAYWDGLPAAFAEAAATAAATAIEARVSGGVGRVPGIAVNRRERTADGRTILGWNPDGFRDDSVPTIRIDAAVDGRAGDPLATVVGFACHPVVLGPEVPLVSSDFVGPMRNRLEALRPGSTTVYLQGAAGDVLPLEGFYDDAGPEVAFGERLALEAAHAIADVDPHASRIDRLEYGSLTPIMRYRRRVAEDQRPQVIATVRRVIALPLQDAPSVPEMRAELSEREADLDARIGRGEGRASTNLVAYQVNWLRAMIDLGDARPTALDAEIWAARLGECAIVGAPGEIFGQIGHEVRAGSPAAVTIFAGYSNGTLGYVPTAAEFPFGGYEPAVSHRGYGQPAPFRPDAGEMIVDAAHELLGALFDR
jgi:hypothetical protein